MKNGNLVYSFSLWRALIPLAGYSNFFNLNYNNCSFKIKSISWDYAIHLPPPDFNPLPVDTQTTSLIYVIIGAAPPLERPISRNFEGFTIAPVPGDDYNGTRFFLHKPKQIIFDSWIVMNNLPINVFINNRDALLTYNYRADLIIEIKPVEVI